MSDDSKSEVLAAATAFLSLRELMNAKVDANRAESEARFDNFERATALAFANAQRSIDRADAATEKRFEAVNEFRSQLNDQAGRFATRELAESMIEKLALQIVRQRDDMGRFATREYVDGAVDKVNSQAARLREELDTLVKRTDLRQGKEEGQKLSSTTIAMYISMMVALVGLAVLLAKSFTGR